MITELLALNGAGLRRQFDAGHPVPTEALADTRYLGVSLGMPAFVDRALWKTFEKTFHLDAGRLRGWNVRLEQTGLDGPVRPLRRRGAPWTFGHYLVVDGPTGVELDYARGANPRLDPTRAFRDPLVALRADDPTWLFGRMDVALPGGRRLPTPSYFVLRHLGPLG